MLKKNSISDGFECFISNVIVPKAAMNLDHDCSGNITVADDCDINLVELNPTKRQHEHVDPSLSELRNIDPSLVFLCYRGFNHISCRIQTGKAVLAKV